MVPNLQVLVVVEDMGLPCLYGKNISFNFDKNGVGGEMEDLETIAMPSTCNATSNISGNSSNGVLKVGGAGNTNIALTSLLMIV